MTKSRIRDIRPQDIGGHLLPFHPKHDPKTTKFDKNTKAEAIKLDDNTCDETKEATDLPMADHNAAESREETGYKLRHSSMHRAVIDKPQGDIITSEAVKVVRTMGNRCSNCACACRALNGEAGTSNPSCKATKDLLIIKQ